MKHILYKNNQLISVHNSASLAINAIPSGEHRYHTIVETTIGETEEIQRAWRDSELEKTDFILPITDYSNRSDFLDYRTELRNWPSTASLFPNVRPTGSDAITASLAKFK